MPAESGLWDFAVSTYSHPGVSDACLSLQDRLGADVAVLLYALWLARLGTPSTDIKQAVLVGIAQTAEWSRTVVKPLRSVRRELKTYAAGQAAGTDNAALQELREDVKSCELAGERVQLGMLEKIAAGSVSGLLREASADELTNALVLYFAAADIALDDVGRQDIARIVGAVRAV